LKTIILIRHAKSDWVNLGLNDFDRPLNERGKKDAPIMANRLLEKKITIDAFISSPAKRAAKTAGFFVEAFHREKGEIIFKPELYMAAPSVFFKVITKTDDTFNSIAVFSHNNGITDFINMLTDTRIDNMPTCGVFAIKAQCETWKEFMDCKKDFWFFDYPKSIH
jgi:phosphohistidine phosphatase